MLSASTRSKDGVCKTALLNVHQLFTCCDCNEMPELGHVLFARRQGVYLV